jgi:hypothetical protein
MDIEEEIALQQLLAGGLEDPTPSTLLDAHEVVKQLLDGANSFESALLFASLLLNPNYQANCVRLEALVHLALTTADGNRTLSLVKAKRCFDDLHQGSCGAREDPIEDVFVNLVITEIGEFRVLEGIWESGGFYLQRFFDVLATAPRNTFFSRLCASSQAMLTLSDRLCGRFGLTRYAVGAKYPAKVLDKNDISKDWAKRVTFTETDLKEMGVRKSDLSPFILTDEWSQRLLEFPICQSPLQQLPLIAQDDGVAFALPSATTYAIRMYLTRSLIDGGYRTSLVQQLGNTYLRLFKHTPNFGLPRDYPLTFSDKALKTAECIEQIDSGRYVHKLFILDDLEGIEATGVSGFNESYAYHANTVYDLINRAQSYSRKQAGFRRGFTLIVTCGIGRGSGLPMPDVGADWSVEAISAPDMVTLASTKSLHLKTLWKIFDAFDRLEQAGIKVSNINGMLNLIGWMKSNDWQVIQHSQVPKAFRAGGFLQLSTNFLLDLRVRAAVDSDRSGIRHAVKGVISCRKDRDSFFASENELPIYMPEIVETGEPIPFVYRSVKTTWWCTAHSNDRAALYERWMTLKTWIPRIVPPIEELGHTFAGEVSMAVTFLGCVGDGKPQAIPSINEIRNAITIQQCQQRLIVLIVGESFDHGLQATTNVSESALVETLCTAILQSAHVNVTDRDLSVLLKQIVPSEHARYLHVFPAKQFRDFVTSSLREKPIEIDEVDSAPIRVGLAFRVESREKGRFATRTKKQSKQLLNAIVADLERELCSFVQKFDRESLVKKAMLNHELAMFSRQRWMRTARANVALRNPVDDVSRVITKTDVEISSPIFLSQVVAELAVCEAPLTGGIVPGELDFARMMSLGNAIAQLGGWSDAIHLDAMPPGLAITPLGDVQADTQFRNDVVLPFSSKSSEVTLEDSVARSDEYYESEQVDESSSVLDQQFNDAWNEEIGVELEDIRVFLDAIEDVGIRRQEAVMTLTKDELLMSCGMASAIVDRILDAFVLKPRATWSTIPDEFHLHDVQLWRYRRQLSAVRRPIIQITEDVDPRLIVAPGFVRECFVYVVKNYYEGTFHPRHFKTDSIKKWHGLRINQRGKNFGELVAQSLRRLGWNCWTEKNVSTLAKCGKNPNYGDVDVVAWNAVQHRLLLIECKDLYYGKTMGEIAEQLQDYRGEIRKDGSKQKRDDLRKHLDRLKILNERRSIVCQSLGIAQTAAFEGWTVFKNPVPMLYAWEKFAGVVRIATFDDLAQIANSRIE